MYQLFVNHKAYWVRTFKLREISLLQIRVCVFFSLRDYEVGRKENNNTKGTLRSGVDVRMRTNKHNEGGRRSEREKQSFK